MLHAAGYAPGAADEVTVPPADPVREAKDWDIDDPAHVKVDPEVLRQGGPTKTPGAVTTTGGAAGPAMKPTPGHKNEGRVAPTTTGDATTGGMTTPRGGSTSDAAMSGAPDGGPEGAQPQES